MKKRVQRVKAAKTKKPENPSAAPQVPEDPSYTVFFEDIVRDSCRVCATDEEIAAILSISVERLLELGTPLLRKHRALARVALRTRMFNLVEKEIGASASVAVWLSKQHLEMREPEKEKEPEDANIIVETVDYSKS